MHNAIHVNWGDYLLLVGFIVVLYWIIVGMAFFRREIKNFLSGRNRSDKDDAPGVDSPFENRSQETRQTSLFPVGSDYTGQEVEERSERDLFLEVYALAGEIRAFIQAAGLKRMVRGELIRGLQSLVGQEQYRHLNESRYRVALNNVVAVEAEEQCGIHFDAEEVNEIWDVNDRS